MEVLKKREKGNDHCQWDVKKSIGGGGATTAVGGGGGMGMCKVVGMCHNMMSFFLFTAATISNTIAIINEIPLGLLMLLLLMPWDIVHLKALSTLFDLL